MEQSWNSMRDVPADRLVGCRVVRGRNWDPFWDRQSITPHNIGTVKHKDPSGEWVYVAWDGDRTEWGYACHHEWIRPQIGGRDKEGQDEFFEERPE